MTARCAMRFPFLIRPSLLVTVDLARNPSSNLIGAAPSGAMEEVMQAVSEESSERVLRAG